MTARFVIFMRPLLLLIFKNTFYTCLLKTFFMNITIICSVYNVILIGAVIVGVNIASCALHHCCLESYISTQVVYQVHLGHIKLTFLWFIFMTKLFNKTFFRYKIISDNVKKKRLWTEEAISKVVIGMKSRTFLVQGANKEFCVPNELYAVICKKMVP